MMAKIVCCWNAEIRNNGTARRVWDAMVRMGLKDSGLVRHNRPPYEEVKWSDYDFMLFVDDGRDEIPMPKPGIPSCCWLVDTHLGYDQRLNWAREFDQVFVAQKPAVEQFQKAGIERVSWLPLACHPPVDPTAKELVSMGANKDLDELARKWDVVFVGFLNDDQTGHSRIDYLDEVFKVFPNSHLAVNRFFTEAAQRYAQGRVGFNISIRDDLNMRFFEVLSYGCCLVSNRNVVGWQELGFIEGKHFVGYEGPDEAVEAVRWCLENPVERFEIARAGHQLVRKNHNYEDRVRQIIETMESLGKE